MWFISSKFAKRASFNGWTLVTMATFNTTALLTPLSTNDDLQSVMKMKGEEMRVAKEGKRCGGEDMHEGDIVFLS